MNRNIYLVGFMGSGKSTIGPLLSKRLGYAFHDLDTLIEAHHGHPIGEIFETKGEPFFRELESECLRNSLDLAPYVMALGGGSFVAEDNRSFVSRHGVSVWLDIPLALAKARCKGSQRPLAKDGERFEALYHARQRFYRLADIQIQVEGQSPRQICLEALALLRDNAE